VSGGTYLLFYSCEWMRTNTGGGNRILARLLNMNTSTTLAHIRRVQGMENSNDTPPATGVIPPDLQFDDPGDVLSFDGVVPLTLAAGSSTTFQFQFAITNNTNSVTVMRVRRQRIALIKIGP
jgi:hypothetical protein